MTKSYRAFTARWYHILVWFCYPVAAIICCLALQNGVFGLVPRFSYSFEVPQSFLGTGLCVAEIFLDAFCLGGICSKDYVHFELFKSSKNGKKIFKGILVMDTIRRALLFLFLYVTNVAISLMLGKEVVFLDYIYAAEGALWTYMICTAAVLLTRFTMHLAINLATAYGFMLLGMLLQAILTWVTVGEAILATVFGVVSIVLTVLLLMLPMKKLEGSYYDR